MDTTSLNMPTQASVGSNSHASSINDFNVQLRAQPWYQDWFRQQGLDPNNVHLSQGQRQQLQNLILQRGGVPPDAFNDMKIDPAGNLNTEHGFASQPTWLKGLEIGGAAAGGLGAGALLGAFGSSIPTIGGTTYGSGMAATAPSLTGAGALPSIAGASSALPSLAGGFVPSAAASGMAAGGPASITGVTGGGVAADGSMLGTQKAGSSLSHFLPGGKQSYADAGSLLESFGNDEQNSRLTKGNQAQRYDQLMLDAAANKRADESDAMKKLDSSSYILGGGSKFALPPSLSLGGRASTIPDLGFGVPPVSDAEKQGASTLQDQMLKRLQPGGSYTPTPLSSYDKPGVGENIGKYGSLASSGLGLAKDIFGF